MEGAQEVAVPRPPRNHIAMIQTGQGVALFAALMLLWQASIVVFHPASYIVSSPALVAESLIAMVQSGPFLEAALETLSSALAGFALATAAGVALGVLLAESRSAERLIYPYIAALQNMPKVAIAPLIMIWFGVGDESKIVLAALLSFFPVLINTFQGMKSVDEKRVQLLRSLNADPLQMLLLLKLVSALPYLIVGLELAAIYAMLGIIVAELVGAGQGIGSYLLSLNQQLDAAGSFAVLFILAAYGTVVQRLFLLLRKRFIEWAQVSDHGATP